MLIRNDILSNFQNEIEKILKTPDADVFQLASSLRSTVAKLSNKLKGLSISHVIDAYFFRDKKLFIPNIVYAVVLFELIQRRSQLRHQPMFRSGNAIDFTLENFKQELEKIDGAELEVQNPSTIKAYEINIYYQDHCLTSWLGLRKHKRTIEKKFDSMVEGEIHFTLGRENQKKINRKKVNRKESNQKEDNQNSNSSHAQRLPLNSVQTFNLPMLQPVIKAYPTSPNDSHQFNQDPLGVLQAQDEYLSYYFLPPSLDYDTDLLFLLNSHPDYIPAFIINNAGSQYLDQHFDTKEQSTPETQRVENKSMRGAPYRDFYSNDTGIGFFSSQPTNKQLLQHTKTFIPNFGCNK